MPNYQRISLGSHHGQLKRAQKGRTVLSEQTCHFSLSRLFRFCHFGSRNKDDDDDNSSLEEESFPPFGGYHVVRTPVRRDLHEEEKKSDEVYSGYSGRQQWSGAEKKTPVPGAQQIRRPLALARGVSAPVGLSYSTTASLSSGLSFGGDAPMGTIVEETSFVENRAGSRASLPPTSLQRSASTVPSKSKDTIDGVSDPSLSAKLIFRQRPQLPPRDPSLTNVFDGEHMEGGGSMRPRLLSNFTNSSRHKRQNNSFEFSVDSLSMIHSNAHLPPHPKQFSMDPNASCSSLPCRTIDVCHLQRDCSGIYDDCFPDDDSLLLSSDESSTSPIRNHAPQDTGIKGADRKPEYLLHCNSSTSSMSFSPSPTSVMDQPRWNATAAKSNKTKTQCLAQVDSISNTWVDQWVALGSTPLANTANSTADGKAAGTAKPVHLSRYLPRPTVENSGYSFSAWMAVSTGDSLLSLRQLECQHLGLVEVKQDGEMLECRIHGDQKTSNKNHKISLDSVVMRAVDMNRTCLGRAVMVCDDNDGTVLLTLLPVFLSSELFVNDFQELNQSLSMNSPVGSTPSSGGHPTLGKQSSTAMVPMPPFSSGTDEQQPLGYAPDAQQDASMHLLFCLDAFRASARRRKLSTYVP